MEYDDIVAQYQIDESRLEIENNIPTVEKEKVFLWHTPS